MTESTQQPTEAVEPDGAQTPTGEAQEAQTATQDRTEVSEPDDTGDNEAARYRRRLRDTEAERDQLREQITALRRQTAEDASGLTQPKALWAADVNPDSLFGEDGRLDHDALSAAVTEAAETLGLARAPRTPKPDMTQGRNQTGPPRAQWEDALKPS